jgi:hypothetical protein
MPKPLEKPGKKDPKLDKRYKDGSFFKALHEPPVPPVLLDTPEKALAARENRKQKIRDRKRERIEDPRNRKQGKMKNDAG